MLEFYPRYAALQDSLNEKDKLRYTAAANVRYDTGRKEQEYRALMAEVELKERTLTYIWNCGCIAFHVVGTGSGIYVTTPPPLPA